VIYTPTWVVTTTKLFSLNLEEDFRDRTGGDNTALFLILLWGQERARMTGGDSDCTPWLLLVWWGGRMGITGQVGTATDPAQLIPSLGGFMVLGDKWGTCVCSQGLWSIRHLDGGGAVRGEVDDTNWQTVKLHGRVRESLSFNFRSSFYLGPARPHTSSMIFSLGPPTSVLSGRGRGCRRRLSPTQHTGQIVRRGFLIPVLSGLCRGRDTVTFTAYWAHWSECQEGIFWHLWGGSQVGGNTSPCCRDDLAVGSGRVVRLWCHGHHCRVGEGWLGEWGWWWAQAGYADNRRIWMFYSFIR
jgi:hypothetical protein